MPRPSEQVLFMVWSHHAEFKRHSSIEASLPILVDEGIVNTNIPLAAAAVQYRKCQKHKDSVDAPSTFAQYTLWHDKLRRHGEMALVELA